MSETEKLHSDLLDQISDLKTKVAEKTLIESALSAYQEKLNLFHANTSEGISYLQLDPPLPIDLPPLEFAEKYIKSAKITEANRAFAKMYGFEHEDDVIGKTLLDFWIGDTEQLKEYLLPWVSNNFTLKNQLSKEKNKYGEVIYFINNTVGIIKDGLMFGLWGTQNDVTEQVLAQEKLKESENLYKNLFYANPIPMWVYDRTTLKFLEVNDAAINNYGYSKDDFLNLTLKDVINFEGSKLTSHSFKSVLQKHKKKDKTIIDVEVSSHKIVFEGYEAELLLANDVTEKIFFNNAIQSLLKETNDIAYDFLNAFVKELSYLLKVKYIFVGKVIEDSSRKIRTIAIAVDGFTGNNFEYSLKDTPCEMVVGKAPCIYENDVQSIFPNDHLLVEFGIQSYVGIPLFASNGKPIGLMVAMDDKPMKNLTMTKLFLSIFASRASSELERIGIDEALRESEERLKLALTASKQGLYDLDLSTGIAKIDSTYSQMFYNNPNRKSETNEEWINRIHPEDRELVLNAYNDYVNKISENYKAEARHKNAFGEWIWILSMGKIVEYDSSGKPKRLVGTYLDITDRKLQEAKIQEYLNTLENKNAELERFSYTVSHDLKSPVITIKGFLGMLLDDAKSGNIDRLVSDIERISKAADKMQSLLEDLLLLSRLGKIVNPSAKFSTKELLKETLDLLQGQITPKNVKIIIDENLPDMEADRTRIGEVFQNLIENGIKYLGDQQNPIIEIGFSTKNKQHTYYVKDNGIGIQKEYFEKIFGLFDKLDPNTEGNGIGLAFVKRVIELHGGKIWVHSDGPGKGSVFYFTINPKMQRSAN